MNRYNDEDIENLIQNIKFLKKKNMLSKRKMADILGISIYSLNIIEKGEIPVRLTVDAIFGLSDYFKIKPAELLSKRLE